MAGVVERAREIIVRLALARETPVMRASRFFRHIGGGAMWESPQRSVFASARWRLAEWLAGWFTEVVGRAVSRGRL